MILLDPIYKDLVPVIHPASAGYPFLEELRKQGPMHGLTDPDDQAVFLAHAIHETQWFTRLEENLYYRWPTLMKTWPKRYWNPVLAQDHHMKPEKIANYVYAKRLGNYLPNDGWYFRGRGIFMTTGRDNYNQVARKLFDKPSTLMLKPELLKEPRWAVASALLYWKDRKMSAFVDPKTGKADIKKSTLVLNGGTNGLADRIHIHSLILPWVKTA